MSGAVNAPLAVTWAEGKNMDFYVASAGGYSRDADKGRAYVTQPSGKVESVHRRFLLPDGKPVPAAGATIFVPEKDKTKPAGNTLQITGDGGHDHGEPRDDHHRRAGSSGG